MTRAESDMGSRSRLATFFSLNYGPGIWLPVGLAVAGFAGLEMNLHCRIGYPLLMIPFLAPSARAIEGALRRLLVAYLLVLGAGGLLALSPRPGTIAAAPCLLIAGCAVVSLFFARNERFALTALSAGTAAAIALAAFVIELHGPIDIVFGLALGAISFRLAFSKTLFFLDRADPWTGIAYELDNLWNLFVSNTRQKWERNYASGSWDFLDSPAQRGRHYAIAGIIVDRHPEGGARILDAGCGLGTLYPLLRGRVGSYTGLDFSEEVIKRCRSAFSGDPGCSFASGAFEDFAPREPFDVVVLNEVLYYFPASRAVEMFQKALSHARDGGLLIVSMNRSWKSRLIRAKVNAIAAPLQSLRVTNLQTGSFWTVELYSRAKERGLSE